MQIQELLNQALNKTKISKYKTRDIITLDLENLLSSILGKPRVYLLTYGEKKLHYKQIQKFNQLLQKYQKNYPLAYLIGRQEFYGLRFKVNKNVLIPRPETELIIDLISKKFKKNQKFKKIYTIIDLGTGSGCIIITLAKLLEEQINNFLAIDISKKALQIARQNARLNKISSKIKFLYGDLLEPILKNNLNIKKNSHLIIATNLPYLTPTQIKKSPTIKHEPRLALLAGSDGLDLYRKLFKQLEELNKINPKLNFDVFCEIDHTQSAKMHQLISKQFQAPKTNIQIHKDLAGFDRVVQFSRK